MKIIYEVASSHQVFFQAYIALAYAWEDRDYFKNRPHAFREALIVAGSYGRKRLSNLFKKGFIKEAIEEHRHPLFIDHQK